MPVVALTTLQRDLLRLLLGSDEPIVIAELGRQSGVSPRQAQYGLRGVEAWLAQRNATLTRTPGVGVRVECPAGQRSVLLSELLAQGSFQLVLTAGQRQQLLALQLLTAHEPSILYQLQQSVDVSRTTILKDLDVVEAWLRTFNLQLERRPNYGCWLRSAELAQRQALAALLWGDSPFEDPMFAVTHQQGLVLPFNDIAIPPGIQPLLALPRSWALSSVMPLIDLAETELGLRFADETVLEIALALQIQQARVAQGQLVQHDEATTNWLAARSIWPTAMQVGTQLLPLLQSNDLLHEVATIAMHLLSGSCESSLHDLGLDDEFRGLIDGLMQQIAEAIGEPDAQNDAVLRNGLEVHIIPACMRQRFRLWSPRNQPLVERSQQWDFERPVVTQLSQTVALHTEYVLPPREQHNLALLVRAAAIRARSARPPTVLVVCPSGMATTQFLVARFRLRFPHLGVPQVLSLRDLDATRIAEADLIISTVPLTLPHNAQVDVVQVDPMLSAHDIERIRQWYNKRSEHGALYQI